MNTASYRLGAAHDAGNPDTLASRQIRSPSVHILITAGPTREPIDSVRVLTNRSSGRMGVALAAESAARGHDVTLLLGQAVAAAPCCGVHCERFDSTRDLAGMLDTHFPACDLLIMAAAVSDFIPEEAAEGKLDRRKGPCSLALSPAPDLVAQLAAVRRPDQRIVGFALEAAEDLEARAVAKMRRKNLDAIVGNPLATMEGVRVSGLLAQADGSVRTAPPDATKPAFAAWLLDRLHL